MYQAIVIGAGHAGLAAAYLLKRKGYNRVIVLEASVNVANAWRKRYEGLTLFTSRRFSQLPGLAMPGEQNDYPYKQEFVDYLKRYHKVHDLNVSFNVRVLEVKKIPPRLQNIIN